MTEPDLLYSEEEEALRAAVRGLLADHCEPAGVIARTESATPHDTELWKALTDGMGLAGLLISPTKGLLVFSPFLLFVLLAWRHLPRGRADRGLTLAMSVAVALQILLIVLLWWSAVSSRKRVDAH